jgi:hypothetical protein
MLSALSCRVMVGSLLRFASPKLSKKRGIGWLLVSERVGSEPGSEGVLSGRLSLPERIEELSAEPAGADSDAEGGGAAGVPDATGTADSLIQFDLL